MNTVRIKSLLIAALVMVNVLFLTVIVADSVAGARSERQAVINACMILSSGGISIDPEDVSAAGNIRSMRTIRGIESEILIAQSVLGPVEKTDQGTINHYENMDKGIADFYSAGDFEISLNDGVFIDIGDKIKTVKKLLNDMKIETAVVSQSGTRRNEIITAVCAYKGASIFNCTIEFGYNGEVLMTVKGRFISGAESMDDGKPISTAGTALLNFFAAVRNGDVECSHIDSVEAGYQHRAVGSLGDGVIEPAWLISADTGRYILDDSTGEIVSRQLFE